MAGQEFGYERFGIWQKGMQLVGEIYLLTREFPAEERFGLTAQLRRAAVSVPANIAEGYGRESNTQLKHFVRIPLGSVYEIRTELEIAAQIGIVPRERLQIATDLSLELSRMLGAFIRNTAT